MADATASALTRLGARDAGRRIAAGDLTSAELVAACLERIAEREPVVRAWAHLDPEAALEQARARDAEAPRGPLHGVPVAVKDIVDTVDLPTEWGTPIHAGRRPERDAECVARLREAGAVILGKTVTTEMATYEPPRTRNPVNPDHTPGGSSSGSAAAVADWMAPLALGSQTAGSVIRPAAFCGVLGLKPTRGLLSLTGVMGLSPRLDTLGLFAREAADLELAGAALSAAWEPVTDEEAERAPAVAFARTPWWDRADEAAHRSLETAAERLAAAGARVRELGLPPGFAALPEAHETLMGFDLARTRAREYDHHAEMLSDRLREVMDQGRATAAEDAEAAVRLGAACAVALEELVGGDEVLLVPAAAGEAPPLAENTTGDPLFCRPWTLLGSPALSVPGPAGPHGLPVGAQLVAPAGRDHALRAAGAWVAARLAP
jgi:Asp-tRNA(Asn)/Glu-tRNA(Gln) amidotransferase A subunit family amidase